MAWLCKETSVVNPSDDPIIDVKKTIEDWAWNHFLKTTNKWKMFLKRKKYIVDVPMNYYLFEDTDTIFEDINPDPTLKVKEMTNAEKDKDKDKEKTKDKDPDMDMANPNVSILSTKYVNDTGKSQVYKFRMERTRKASVTISSQKGFSIEGEAKFSIGVADGKVNSKFEVTNIRTQVFEQTLLFETSSDINVEERTDCTAMVVFTERETRMRFKLQTKMSLSSGSAPIYIKRKKDGQIAALIKLTNLRPVFKKFEKPNVLELIKEQYVDGVGDTYNIHSVRLFTEGIIEGVRLSDQTVKLRAFGIGENGSEIGNKKEELKKHNDFHNPHQNQPKVVEPS